MDRAFLDKHKEELWAMYLDKGRQGVSDFVGVTYNGCGHVLSYLGFYKRLQEYHHFQRTRPHYENIFLKDTPVKYYLLGYILGDGNIHFRREDYGILNISSSDKEHLEWIASNFGASLQGPWKGNYVINVQDTPICLWLMAYGIGPRKSLEGATFPEIPEKYKYAFLCGLLDSDGCIRKTNKGNTLIAQWVGHPSYMKKVCKMIEGASYWESKKGLAFVTIHKQEYVKKFLTLLYANTPKCLERKHEKFTRHEFSGYRSIKYFDD